MPAAPGVETAIGKDDLKDFIAPDGQGGLWGGHNKTLRYVNNHGQIVFEFKPFAGYNKDKITDIAAEPNNNTVWVANKNTLKQYDINGALLNEFTPDLGDGVIRKLHRMRVAGDIDTEPPTLQITAPLAGAILNTDTPAIELRYEDTESGVDTDTLALMLNDMVISTGCTADETGAQCIPDVPLPEGLVTLTATVADNKGLVAEPAHVTFTVDTLAPEINLSVPEEGHVTNQTSMPVTGQLSEAVADLTVNGASATVDSNHVFATTVSLTEGINTITVVATDEATNVTTVTRTVTRDTVSPDTAEAGLVTVSPPINGRVTVTGQADSVEPGAQVTVTNVRTANPSP